jgi:hypothetical protein
MNSKRSTRLAALLTAAAATVGLLAVSVAPAHADTYAGETLTVDVTPHDGRSTIGDNVSFYTLADAEEALAASQANLAQVKAANKPKVTKVKKCKKSYKKKFGKRCITKTKVKYAPGAKRAIAAAQKDFKTATKCSDYISNAYYDNRAANASVDTSKCPWAGTYLAPFWAGTNDLQRPFNDPMPKRHRMSDADRRQWAQHQDLTIPANVPNSATDVANSPAEATALLNTYYPQLSAKAKKRIAENVGTEFIQVRRSTHPDIVILLSLGPWGYLNQADNLHVIWVNTKMGSADSISTTSWGPTAETLLSLTWSTIPPLTDPAASGVCLTPPCAGPGQPAADPNVYYGYLPGVTPGSMGAWVVELDDLPPLNLDNFYIY